MFNGTARHPQGEFDRLMEAHGASNNAYTAQDVTVYQDWFPPLGPAAGVRAGERSDLAQSAVRSRDRRERAQGGLLRAPPAHRRQQCGAARGAGAGDGIPRASVPHPDDRLAVGHPVVATVGPAALLRHVLRAQQLHLGAGRRLRSG